MPYYNKTNGSDPEPEYEKTEEKSYKRVCFGWGDAQFFFWLLSRYWEKAIKLAISKKVPKAIAETYLTGLQCFLLTFRNIRETSDDIKKAKEIESQIGFPKRFARILLELLNYALMNNPSCFLEYFKQYMGDMDSEEQEEFCLMYVKYLEHKVKSGK